MTLFIRVNKIKEAPSETVFFPNKIIKKREKIKKAMRYEIGIMSILLHNQKDQLIHKKEGKRL
jgi:hypothetical protein